ncbi:MAG TPA: tetratricopeptide repeat protein [Opitutaceae bacterium]|nr:tetratricopeptide repeat protein [Opitutaceae bacterium]
MTQAAPSPSAVPGRAPWAVPAAAALIVAAGLAAYANSLHGPFLFDDVSSIPENPSIRHLWPLSGVLRPPAEGGLSVGGRPLVNLSLALNYAVGGLNPAGYHALNLAFHLAAGLALFGLARRALDSLGAGLAVALLWTVHPLQTEAVSYVIQRTEGLMALLYLLTLYAFARRWLALSVVCCLLGMAAKEVMVSAPVMVLLYDRAFVAGSFRQAWRARRGYYLALAATWVPLLALLASTGGNRGGTSGFGLGVGWFTYFITQGPAILHYLRLALWPCPLVVLYPALWTPFSAAAPALLAVLALAGAAAVAWWRRPAWGFWGVWFFAVLAPTSLIPGRSQTLAEHRMYLALAPVLVALVAAARALARRSGLPRWTLGAALAAAALAGAGLTHLRNRAYASEVALWSDTVRHQPGSPYSQNNLGIALAGAGRLPEAASAFEAAVRLKPDYAEAHNNLGLAWTESGRADRAIAEFRAALRYRPRYPEAEANLGMALANSGRTAEAAALFQQALRENPDYLGARDNLAVLYLRTGRAAEAAAQFQEVLRADSGSADVWSNLGLALLQLNRAAEAAGAFQRAVRLRPGFAEAQANLGVALAESGRLPEAVSAYRAALALLPADADVHYNLGLALRSLGLAGEAGREFAEAERLRPGR